ncbi:MAG: hypothetical protein FJ293_06000 [Planctomycetes bacterium]|nr:hypothetical protein [Planctomycetota bacterium]
MPLRRVIGCCAITSALGATHEPVAPSPFPSLAPSSATTTWVVDDDGPANFADLPDAVLAARDGDIILLRPGRYGAAQVRAKGLRIIGSGPGSTFLEQRGAEGPFFAASDLSNQQQLLLANLTGIGRGRTLELTRLHGAALLADLVIDGSGGARGPVLDQCLAAIVARVAVLPSVSPLDGGNGFTVANGHCALTQVVAIGAPGSDGKSPRGHGRAGGNGLAIVDADVEAAWCDWSGGAGGAALWDVGGPFCPEAATAGPGGAALSIAGRASLRLAGDGRQQLRGGDGGAATLNPWEKCWSFAGDAGPAVRLRGDVDVNGLQVSGVVLSAGAPGAGDAERPGKAAPTIEPIDATLGDPARRWPLLAVETIGAPDGMVEVRILGSPGDRVTLLVGQDLVGVPLKKSEGFRLHLGSAHLSSLPQPQPIGADGEMRIRARLPAEATLVGSCFGVQAVIQRRMLGGRQRLVSNVDLVVVADGGGRAAVAER